MFVGALLGAMLTYLFSSLAIKAVGRTAQMVVKDVRASSRRTRASWPGRRSRTMGDASSIVTGAALKEMVMPGVLAVGLPVAVGLIFRHFSASYQAGPRRLSTRRNAVLAGAGHRRHCR